VLRAACFVGFELLTLAKYDSSVRQGQQIVLEATRGMRDHKLSYYDAQIWACARLNQVPVIFTEDFQDGQTLEGIRFVNPFAGNFVIDEW
jgi:predicted nucleic acid-binding protein